MKILAFIFLFAAGIFTSGGLATEAETAYAAGDYFTAALKFSEAIGNPAYDGQEQAIYYNMGQAYYLTDSARLSSIAPKDPSDSSNTAISPKDYAINYFTNASKGKDKQLASMAYNNIGVILAEKGENELALEAFKEAMRKMSDNNEARFNYELLMRKKQQQQEENKDEQKDEEKKDEEKQDQQDKQDQNDQQDQQDQQDEKDKKDQQDQQDQQEKDKEEKDGQAGDQQKQKPRNTENDGEQQEIREIPMDQAKMLLEAMNENEKKFLQQLKKNAKVKTKPEDGPDW